jgi:hypothetical protein
VARNAPARHSDYRPHLDGLRAVAVFLVVDRVDTVLHQAGVLSG